MNRETLGDALAAAEEFVRRGTALYDDLAPETHSIYGYPKETGAIRHQSMELTRALAEMRRS